MTSTAKWLSLAAVLSLMTVGAHAVDWNAYPEFPASSGLPGNGFGVLPDGKVGFGGEFNIAVPCAYTPSLGNVAAVYISGSHDSKPRLQFGGEETDGTGLIGVGLGRPGHSVYASEVWVQKSLSVKCINLQWQVLEQREENPALAIGVFDAFDEREEYLSVPHGARSFYAVASKQQEFAGRPGFASVGYGSGKFGDRPFGAVSWYPTPNINLGFEYDGRMATPHLAVGMRSGGAWSADALIAWSNFERPALGFGLTFSH